MRRTDPRPDEARLSDRSSTTVSRSAHGITAKLAGVRKQPLPIPRDPAMAGGKSVCRSVPPARGSCNAGGTGSSLKGSRLAVLTHGFDRQDEAAGVPGGHPDEGLSPAF